MAALQDLEMERLFDLLARGSLSNAQEIACLLKGELGEKFDPELENVSLQPYLEPLGQIFNRR
jgi:hypothetical protein